MSLQRVLPSLFSALRLRWLAGLVAGAYAACSPVSLQSAVANGDTRTLSLVHAHTHETITATFLVNGQYDQSVLDKLNWFLRDWRRDEPTKMDPRLFDTVWEVYRESGSQQPIMVMSAYRSPETNAMLRRRSRQVAEHSQHILGRAMDQHYMDVPMSRIRELGMRLQRGGVGFYPTAGTPFVHLDVGGVRHWPRMNYDQLARLFPDGKTVHIPSNGQPLPGYEVARAELEARGDGSYPTASQLKTKGLFAWLFGGGGSDEDDDNAAAGVRKRSTSGSRVASAAPPMASEYSVGGYGKNESDRASSSGSVFSLFGSRPASPAPVAQAPATPPAPPPAAPVLQPIPETAMALAVPTSAADGAPVGGAASAVPDLPVPGAFVLPLPPRRPVELAALGPTAPLPPSRPPELAAPGRPPPAPHDAAAAPPGSRKPDPIGALLAAGRSGSLPDVITGGEAARPKALGYAANSGPAQPTAGGAAVPMPVARPAALLPPSLDRSNFRVLTRPEPTQTTVGRSALGEAVPPLRAAVRGDLGVLAPKPVSRATFRSSASDLTSDAFSGDVVRPTARMGTTSRTSLD